MGDPSGRAAGRVVLRLVVALLAPAMSVAVGAGSPPAQAAMVGHSIDPAG